jgi:branched-chain amino acid transport system permease protein
VRRRPWLLAAGAVGLALLAPRLVASSYGANALVTLALYVVLALAFDLMAGHVGAVSLAPPAFYALGAYTAGILATGPGTGFVTNLGAAAALAAAVALLVGWPLFRLSDLTFAIGSLGLGLIAAALANNLEVTGGAMCTTGIPPVEWRAGAWALTTARPASAYYLALGLVGLATLTYLGLTTARTGRALAMVQGDEALAASFGVHALRYKLLAFAASAALIAAAGVFYAHYTGVVCPADFSPFLTVNLLVIVFVGGIGSLGGVVLGALFFVAVSEWARAFQHLGNLIYGVVLLGAVLFLPRGLWGLVAGRRPRPAATTREAGA